MPKYKFKNVYKILLQIWLFYYFLNTIKVHECQMNDVEFITQPKQHHNIENDVGEVPKQQHSDSDYVYEPIDTSHRFNFDDDIDESKNVNLNVNNNLHETETVPQTDHESPLSEITERQISGEKILRQSESPYLLRQDLEVLQSARLTIEPGVTIHFAPLVGITVYGQLRANVSMSINTLLCKGARILSAISDNNI
jgi:hypothetical protein